MGTYKDVHEDILDVRLTKEEILYLKDLVKREKEEFDRIRCDH